jgi:hypothetical protein
MVVHVCNTSTQEVEDGEFEVSLGYTGRSFSKKKKKKLLHAAAKATAAAAAAATLISWFGEIRIFTTLWVRAFASRFLPQWVQNLKINDCSYHIVVASTTSKIASLITKPIVAVPLPQLPPKPTQPLCFLHKVVFVTKTTSTTTTEVFRTTLASG